MRFFTFATAALAAFPVGLARDFPKEFDHKDLKKDSNSKLTDAIQNTVEKIKLNGAANQKHEPKKHDKIGHKHDHHKHDHHKHDHHKIDHKPEHHKIGHKHDHHKHIHEHKHKHHHAKDKELTVKCVCERLHHLAHQADHLYDYVKDIKCGNGDRECWEPVRKALYEIEWELDLFDTAIDKSSLHKCFTDKEEAKISCCFYRYADALIRVLEEISKKLEHIEGETAYYIVTAVNSLRAADYTFVYELVRRLQHEKYQIEIMKKEGATDGSTPHSIRRAFARFVSTPYITGEDFKGKDCHKDKDGALKIIEDIKHKNHHHKGHKDHHHHHHPHHPHHPHHHHGHHDHHHHHHKGHDHKDKEKTHIKIEEHVDHSQ